MSVQPSAGATPQAPSPSPAGPVTTIPGRALPLRGNDIDTDRIMPARFLVAVSFEGLERHLFEDDRKADPAHPFNDARFAGASILVVNANFGCGSSREHAPQGLVRAGMRAIVGESFSEIFQGNAAMLGMPCFVAAHADVDRLQALVESSPETAITADVASGTITAGSQTFAATLPAALRDGFVSGQWNPTAMLLERFDEVRAVAARLPYIRGF
jgi:3-isopropylmalate/(R)-2-methylmalate dehydratase small subunit